MPQKTRIGLIQMKMSADPKKNILIAINKIKDAAKKGAKIICLPELFLTYYFCQHEKHSNFKLAEKIPGPTTSVLSKISKEDRKSTRLNSSHPSRSRMPSSA